MVHKVLETGLARHLTLNIKQCNKQSQISKIFKESHEKWTCDVLCCNGGRNGSAQRKGKQRDEVHEQKDLCRGIGIYAERDEEQQKQRRMNEIRWRDIRWRGKARRWKKTKGVQAARICGEATAMRLLTWSIVNQMIIKHLPFN